MAPSSVFSAAQKEWLTAEVPRFCNAKSKKPFFTEVSSKFLTAFPLAGDKPDAGAIQARKDVGNGFVTEEQGTHLS